MVSRQVQWLRNVREISLANSVYLQNKALDNVKSKANSAAPSRASSVASTNSNTASKGKSKGKKK